jgi:hypothetical protein
VLPLLGALVLCAAAAPSLALPGSKPVAEERPSVWQPAARKGTRNYVPDAGPAATPDTTAPAADPAAHAKALEDCIAIWDAKTHITKSKWREICERQIKERAQLDY